MVPVCRARDLLAGVVGLLVVLVLLAEAEELADDGELADEALLLEELPDGCCSPCSTDTICLLTRCRAFALAMLASPVILLDRADVMTELTADAPLSCWSQANWEAR